MISKIKEMKDFKGQEDVEEKDYQVLVIIYQIKDSITLCQNKNQPLKRTNNTYNINLMKQYRYDDFLYIFYFFLYIYILIIDYYGTSVF